MARMSLRLSKKHLVIGFVLVLLVGGIGVGLWYEKKQHSFPEVAELSTVSYNFQEYSTYFRRLAENKGAVYAYQVLLRASFPKNTDLHLLGHVVGDILYKQKGEEGMYSCTQDFRNACSHSIVIGILQEHGPGYLPKIAELCKKAPGGKGAYTMCFHGLGHGVLAYNNYDFEKAIAMCKQTGTAEYNQREYIECVGGASMELMAGVHDRTAWEKQAPRYFRKDDPLAPCDAPFMEDKVRPICYMHLTPHLFEAAGGSLSELQEETLPKAFSYCDAIPESRTVDRTSCYGGFGKEFIVFVNNRDIRNMGVVNEPGLRKVRELCALAGDVDGERYCNSSALSSLYWGGEVAPDAALTFCKIASSPEREACYGAIADMTTYFISYGTKRKEVCNKLPEPFRERCMSVPR